MTDAFELTENDKSSGLWVRLKAHFEERLAMARARNDEVSHSADSTATLRGEIRVLKRLIALDAPRIDVTGN